MDAPDIRFRLDDRFIRRYASKLPKFGPLGEITYARTYSRALGSTPKRYQALAQKFGVKVSEEFWLTLVRVVEGVYQAQEAHCKSLRLPWNPRKAQRSAQEMYKLMWEFKFLPPGRGLWMMGTDYIKDRGGAALNSCAFVSTKDIKTSFSDPFCFMMDMSMLGVGIGCDTKGAGTINIRQPRISKDTHAVEDSREGWVEILRRYLDAYVGKDTIPEEVDMSGVRKAGTPIKSFGGVSAGPEPLAELLQSIQEVLNPLIGESITAPAIVDIFNLIGRCVVSGNVRRSAELILGDPEDEEFLELKDPSIYPEEYNHHRWSSNNSIFATEGMDYSLAASRTSKNGEPGYLWLENARKYSRMIDPPDWKDTAADGVNPCSEQTLESFELCCLVETFPAHHETYEEFERTLKFAYLYAKTVTLIGTHDLRTNAVMLRNRRIGTSMSGVIQAFQRHGRSTVRQWADQGYYYLKKLDGIYSRWLCIPESIKITSIKPSGTVSLLPGATPGIHFPHSEYYFRVIRFATNSPLVPKLKEAGYRCIELDQKKEPNTTAVYFAVKEKYFDRAKPDVTIWEQLENAAMMQAYWSDNSVSCTVSFKPEERQDIIPALETFETRLKSISFLPLKDHGFDHAPYQTITKKEYEKYQSQLKELDLRETKNEVIDKFCSSDKCELTQ